MVDFATPRDVELSIESRKATRREAFYQQVKNAIDGIDKIEIGTSLDIGDMNRDDPEAVTIVIGQLRKVGWFGTRLDRAGDFLYIARTA